SGTARSATGWPLCARGRAAHPHKSASANEAAIVFIDSHVVQRPPECDEKLTDDRRSRRRQYSERSFSIESQKIGPDAGSAPVSGSLVVPANRATIANGAVEKRTVRSSPAGVAMGAPIPL
ncbi:MAG: hypothetical protein ACK56I_36615, partial [bacterium]